MISELLVFLCFVLFFEHQTFVKAADNSTVGSCDLPSGYQLQDGFDLNFYGVPRYFPYSSYMQTSFIQSGFKTYSDLGYYSGYVDSFSADYGGWTAPASGTGISSAFKGYYFSMEAKGYFYADTTGTYQFKLGTTDDFAIISIGADNAFQCCQQIAGNGRDFEEDAYQYRSYQKQPAPNQLITVQLVGGNYYPIRVLYVNIDNGVAYSVSFTTPTNNLFTTDFKGHVFSSLEDLPQVCDSGTKSSSSTSATTTESTSTSTTTYSINPHVQTESSTTNTSESKSKSGSPTSSSTSILPADTTASTTTSRSSSTSTTINTTSSSSTTSFSNPKGSITPHIVPNPSNAKGSSSTKSDFLSTFSTRISVSTISDFQSYSNSPSSISTNVPGGFMNSSSNGTKSNPSTSAESHRPLNPSSTKFPFNSSSFDNNEQTISTRSSTNNNTTSSISSITPAGSTTSTSKQNPSKSTAITVPSSTLSNPSNPSLKLPPNPSPSENPSTENRPTLPNSESTEYIPTISSTKATNSVFKSSNFVFSETPSGGASTHKLKSSIAPNSIPSITSYDYILGTPTTTHSSLTTLSKNPALSTILPTNSNGGSPPKYGNNKLFLLGAYFLLAVYSVM